MAVHRPTLWRAALVQGLGVVLLALGLGLALPESFFEDWGWLAGPGAWGLAALVTARVLGLPLGRTLVGAALSGLPSLIAMLAGAHWAGAPVAVLVFAVWCAARPGRAGRPAETAAA